MGFRKYLLGTVAVMGLLSQSALAENVAMVVGSNVYRNFANVEHGGQVLTTTQTLAETGYRVIPVRDATMAGLQNAVAELEKSLPDADRVVVILSGAFLHNDTVTWFAPTDLRSPSLAAVGFEGLSVQAILGYLAQKPGGAVLFLGSDGVRGTGELIAKGIGHLKAPQGVLVVQGSPSGITDAINNQFLVKGRSLADAVQLSKDTIKAHGYLSELSTLNPTDEVVRGLSEEELKILAEAAYWRAVLDLSTIGGFNAYLQHYPDGEFVEGANARIQAIKDAQPKYTPAEQTEIDLNLTRNDRSRVQEQLSFLGYNTRGIDGLFGPATRGALTRWQSQNGQEATGFLTAQHLQQLRVQAEKRAKKLAIEASRTQVAHDAADAEFWRVTGANGGEADYLAYLKKYPDGLYAAAARKRLQAFQVQKRNQARASETAKWDAAVKAKTKKGYLTYLEAYPNGAFAEVARGRVSEIEKQQAQKARIQAARAEEEKLPLNPSLRLLLEQQLKKLKLAPGEVDGKFNKATRKALRRYQRSRGLEVSGFLTRPTVVQLMAE
jgi:peptidoglycan hydrolase-like protein with peptidoglycan-binding domain